MSGKVELGMRKGKSLLVCAAVWFLVGPAAHPALALTPVPNERTQTRLFQDLDKNRDGLVTLKEYQDSHQACMRDPKCRAWLEDKFHRLDVNQDGFLSLEEFLAPVKQKKAGKP